MDQYLVLPHAAGHVCDWAWGWLLSPSPLGHCCRWPGSGLSLAVGPLFCRAGVPAYGVQLPQGHSGQ